jgi:GDPmannose 4,6-dehydratase
LRRRASSACPSSSRSYEQPLYTSDNDALGVLRLLEAMREICTDARLYQASSSEMFGKAQAVPQNEATPVYPRSPYGVAKLFAHWSVVNYREAHGLYACSGILFNHESPLRGRDFVNRKVTFGLARVAAGQAGSLAVGNLDAMRDWGFAGEYVEGMWMMLQQAEPDDYVLATGRSTTVREFVDGAARGFGFDLEWTGNGVDARAVDRRTGRAIVTVDPRFYRPVEVDHLVGDWRKAKAVLGWEPRTSLEDLIEMMVKADYDRVKTGIIRC